jgi:hypothetical protein
MARALVIEEGSGTCRGRVHQHNGYYAGDFSATDHSVHGFGAATARHLRVVAAPHVEGLTVDKGTADAGAARPEAA